MSEVEVDGSGIGGAGLGNLSVFALSTWAVRSFSISLLVADDCASDSFWSLIASELLLPLDMVEKMVERRAGLPAFVAVLSGLPTTIWFGPAHGLQRVPRFHDVAGHYRQRPTVAFFSGPAPRWVFEFLYRRTMRHLVGKQEKVTGRDDDTGPFNVRHDVEG
jgi:hypothetical protein